MSVLWTKFELEGLDLSKLNGGSGGGGRKKVGRPNGCGLRGQNVFTGKCDVRLSKEEDSLLTRLAERNETSRSEVMRKALRDFIKFNNIDE